MRYQSQFCFHGAFVGIPQHQKWYIIYVPNTQKNSFFTWGCIWWNIFYCVSIHVTSVFRGTRYVTRSPVYSVRYTVKIPPGLAVLRTPKHFRHHTFWPPCDTNGWYPNQPEVLQLSTPLSRKRKDQVRLTYAEPHHRYRPSVQKILRIPNSDSEIFRIPWTREKVFCVESALTLRIIQFELLISNIWTCNFEHLFQWRRCLIYIFHARAHDLPTQNGNFQLLIWIGQHPKHLKGFQR